MSRKIQLTVYSFDELSEQGKEQAIASLWDINIDHDWWYFCYDHIVAVGEAIGISFGQYGSKRFYFDLDRGSYFQFEGSLDLHDLKQTFDADYLHKEFNESEFDYITDRLKDYKRIFKWDIGEANASITGKWSETSEYETYNAKIDSDETNVQILFDDACMLLEEILQDFRSWALTLLSTEYDYLTSEESIIETIKANEYEFTENGELH